MLRSTQLGCGSFLDIGCIVGGWARDVVTVRRGDGVVWLVVCLFLLGS